MSEYVIRRGRYAVRGTRPDEEDALGDGWVLVDCVSGEVLGADGGAPEDQLLVRDWSWVVDALDAAWRAGVESAAITLEPASPAHDPLTCPCCAAASEMRDELRVPIYEDAEGARQESSEHVVWGDDEGEGCDGQIILAEDPEEAACEWACRVDHASAAYPILIGHASPTANVRAPDGALTRWAVTGVPLPHYSARRTK